MGLWKLLVMAAFMGAALPSVAAEPIEGGKELDGSFQVKSKYKEFGEAHRFIFFAVLEGLYEDGVSRAEVGQILRAKEGQSHDHFIYQCPLCRAVFQASDVYANRPDWHYKGRGHQEMEATFGEGLSSEQKAGLAAADVEARLKTIFGLVSSWINRRLERSRLSGAARADLLAEIELGKAEGLRILKSYKKNPDKSALKTLAPGYANIDACAMCSAASITEFQGMAPMGLTIESAGAAVDSDGRPSP